MKLYFSAAACALSPRIAPIESGLPVATEPVILRTRHTAGGAGQRAVKSKRYVPAPALKKQAMRAEGLLA